MPYSSIAVEKVSEQYMALERRYNYTTPKSFLELIALYRSMLEKRRNETNTLIERYDNGVIKLESTSEQVRVGFRVRVRVTVRQRRHQAREHGGAGYGYGYGYGYGWGYGWGWG